MGMNEIAQESTKSKQDRVETCRTHIPTGPEEAGIEIAVGFKGEKKKCPVLSRGSPSRADAVMANSHRNTGGHEATNQPKPKYS